MRDIKFRAWDKDENKWLKCDELAEISINPILDKYGNGFNLNDSTHVKTNRVVEFVQFTGLLDKNGKEIYGGDICRVYDLYRKEWFKDKVLFTNGIFHFSNWRIPIIHEDFSKIEIIGNIYENSELLENSCTK